METNSQQPAFPIQPTFNGEGQICNERFTFEGLTKREYFAAKAMQALLTGCSSQMEFDPCQGKSLAEKSVSVADELLKQLEAGG